jgi:hypothetical protein
MVVCKLPRTSLPHVWGSLPAAPFVMMYGTTCRAIHVRTSFSNVARYTNLPITSPSTASTMSTLHDKPSLEHTDRIEKALASDLDSFIENPELDRRLNRKFDVRILPWLFGIWLFSFIDRSNIGNARIAGLTTDLGIAKGTSFNVALLVFYIPYILVDVPSNLLVKRLRAGVYLPALITLWGIVCLCLGFVTSFAGLIACRLLLGLFEGGILGGVIIYLAMFYRRHDMMLRNGLFYCAAPLSGAFGGLLASGLAKIEVGGYNRWPWIFFSMWISALLF